MAQHAPQASALSDEQEYLQAYEDVLEKYKGRGKSDWLFLLVLRKGEEMCVTAG